MSFLAESVIALLLEDRIDDLIERYKDSWFLKSHPSDVRKDSGRHYIEGFLRFDPTNNKKYLSWIVKQVALKKLSLPKDGEKLRDNLRTFERFLSIPDFKESRDIQTYDANTLAKTLKKYSGLQSKSQKEKEARQRGVKLISRVTNHGGNYELYEITNKQELMNRAWTAYSAQNPNWKGKPLKPPTPGEEDDREWDDLWCVRFPNYSANYLAAGAFYMVYKNGGPYVGIVWEKGECQTLNNEGISLGIAEEIEPLMKGHMSSKLSGNCSVFANLRFLKGDAQDGETVEPGGNNRGGILDLSGSTLRRLPSRLTVLGGLNISNTPIAELPQGLVVKGGKLMIQGTQITKLPIDLTVDEMEWSAPLTYEETAKLYFMNKIPELKRHFYEVEKNAKLPHEEKEAAWLKFQPELMNYFLSNPEVTRNVKVIYRNVPKSR